MFDKGKIKKKIIKKVRNTTGHKSYQAPRKFAKETIKRVDK